MHRQKSHHNDYNNTTQQYKKRDQMCKRNQYANFHFIRQTKLTGHQTPQENHAYVAETLFALLAMQK